jgi:hypothetical protein
VAPTEQSIDIGGSGSWVPARASLGRDDDGCTEIGRQKQPPTPPQSRGADSTRVVAIHPRQRGRRECRMRSCTRSRACSVESTRVSHHRCTAINRHSLRNGFNGFLRALPGDRALLPPSPGGCLSAKLDASVGASGPHDFTVRASAVRQRTPPRPLHPAPNVRDDRDTSLLWARDGWNQ